MAVLRELLHVLELFEKSDFKRHMARLFVEDLCVWLQSMRSVASQHLTYYFSESAAGRRLDALAKALGALKVRKADTAWPLEDLEREAKEDIAEA